MEETSGVDQPFYLNDAETVTSDHLRSSDMRSLGDNVKLLAVIENLSSDLVSKSENAYKKIDEIDRESEVKSVTVKNLINEFQMLADSQFIENRIYDEDTVDLQGEITENPTADSSYINKSSPDQKILPIIHECISNSLQFIDEKFDLPSAQIKQQNESDEEEDYVKEALAKAYESNPFNKTPLPSIIGSQEFFNQSLFNDGGNQATETNREYYSEPSDKLSDDNDESQDSDEEEQNLFTTINDSTRNYPLNSSSVQTEKKLDGKDEVGYLNSSQFSTGQKAEIERKVIEKKPVSLMDEFSDDSDDDDDDDLFTISSSKIRTPNAKINDSAKITKEEKVGEESKVMKVPLNIPTSNASDQIKPIHNSSARTESDDSSDDSLFSDFKSKLSKILTNKPTNDKSDSARVSREIRSSSTSSNSSKDNVEKISTIQPKNDSSEKNLFGETSDDEKDDLFEIKKKPIVPSLVERISDNDDDDDDLFTISSSKIRTPNAKINDSAKITKEDKVEVESKVTKVPLDIPSSKTNEQIKSIHNSSARIESDDSSDDSLFSDFKSKLSKILTKKPTNDKSDSARVSREIRSSSTSSTSSKDNVEKISTIQPKNDSSEKNLFGEASDDEKDDLFKIKKKPIVPSLVERISDNDDDDDDLFTTSSSKIQTPIAKINESVISKKEEKVDVESKVTKVPLDIPSSKANEQIRSPLNTVSTRRPESDDSSDDSLFSDFKSKASKILTNKPTNDKSDFASVSKEIRSPSISSTSSKDNVEKKSTIARNNSPEKNLFGETSDDEKDDLFEVKKKPIAPSLVERISDDDDDDDDLFTISSSKIRTPNAKINDSASTKSTKEEKVDVESKVTKISLNIPSPKTSEQIRSALNTVSNRRPESDDSSDDSLFSDFKSKASSKAVERKGKDKDKTKSPFVQIAPSSTMLTTRKEDLYKNLFDGSSDDDQGDLFAVKNESKPPPVKPRYNIRKSSSQQKEEADH